MTRHRLIPNDLRSDFFDRDTVSVAQSLIGKRMMLNDGHVQLGGIVSETEAYTQEDPACHAFGGKMTDRNRPMFSRPGTIYIYFIYGMYYCLNIVTERLGRGCAVLIRGVVPVKGESIMKKRRSWTHSHSRGFLNGPGKIMQAFSVPLHWSGKCIDDGDVTLAFQDEGDQPRSIEVLPRVGLSKGGDYLWRFRCYDFD